MGGEVPLAGAETVYKRIVGDSVHPVDVHAIGILGNGTNNLDVLNKFDNTDGADQIESADALYDAIASVHGDRSPVFGHHLRQQGR